MPGEHLKMVEASDIGMTFRDGTQALLGVDMAVSQGEFVAIVGPSGCGKSTLLRLVAGLLQPTTGEVTVRGLPPDAARGRELQVSFVFQSPALLPWRTVTGNVRLPLELRREIGQGTPGEIAAILERVGLAGFGEAHPHQLSGGMRMRASVARALITRPDLLLLDEPFGALDEITRRYLNEELLGLWERDGWTALFVTHNVGEAVFLSDRVLVMSPRPGRFVADVTVPFGHPRTPELRSEAAFAGLCGNVSAALREAV